MSLGTRSASSTSTQQWVYRLMVTPRSNLFMCLQLKPGSSGSSRSLRTLHSAYSGYRKKEAWANFQSLRILSAAERVSVAEEVFKFMQQAADFAKRAKNPFMKVPGRQSSNIRRTPAASGGRTSLYKVFISKWFKSQCGGKAPCSFVQRTAISLSSFCPTHRRLCHRGPN